MHVGMGAGVAVLGLMGRKLAVQAGTMMAGEWDQALAAEHKAALALFDKLSGLREQDHLKRKMLLAQLKHALGRHAFEEENTVYPAMRDAGLKDEADALIADHGYVKQHLYELGKLIDDHPAFQAELAEFRRLLERHMREEESQLFVKLKARLDARENKILTMSMNREGMKLA